jgi:hypothetical protein
MADERWIPVASLGSYLEAETMASQLREHGVIAKSDDAVEDLAASTIADFFRVLVPESQEGLALRTITKISSAAPANGALADPELQLDELARQSRNRTFAIVLILVGNVGLLAGLALVFFFSGR